MPDPFYVASISSNNATSADVIWHDWNIQVTSVTASIASYSYSTDNTVWVTWSDSSLGAEAQVQSVVVPYHGPGSWRNDAAVVGENRYAKADKRAERLLLEHLDQEQRLQYETANFFDVLTTRDGKVRRYRITKSWVGNVYLIDDKGRRVEQYCIHPRSSLVPIADSLLTQKLMLQHEEDRFLKTANMTLLRAAA